MRNKVLGSIGALLAGIVIIFGSTFVVYPAISQLVGLAVVGNASGTLWNNVKDAGIQTDAATSGLLSIGLMGYNGTTWDRLRSTTANGLQIGGTVTPSDGFANPSTAVTTWSILAASNGSTYDGLRAISATTNTATSSRGALDVVQLSTWSVTHTPAANTRATASKAAGGGTVRHVATGVTICLLGDQPAASSGLATTHLRDGATGAGTILRTWLTNVTGGADESKCIDLTGLNMTGSANTAMTLEFTGASGTDTYQTVTLTGYSTP
jgi:hypothetical protein